MYKQPTAADVWGTLGREGCGGVADANIEKALKRAERKLRLVLAQRGCDFDKIAADPLRGEYLADLLVEAVARVERNAAVKEGYKTETEGAYSYSVLSSREVSTNLWWPDDELAVLGACGKSGSRRVGTILVGRRRRDW